ncbi:MAG: hypothetical protein IBX50_04185 [Marinospirillum sp.]|uniref:hypothetical protein n=1 Tax=Marinospirillum sp. TaxID=2183934 RepID=UPI001A075FE8|nr:hypothetical protein [Marinospirillum sp.]MBE0505905.1 hypothetical protein [Marinospirillum sp.]
MQHQLVQKILIDGEEADISLMQSFTYIETLSLDSPKFIIVMQDNDNLIRDDFGLQEGSVLTVVLLDQHLQGGLDITEDVVVRSITGSESGLITIHGFPEIIDTAKKPASKAFFLVDMPINAIGAAMMPGAAVDADPMPSIDRFHLLPGERPTRKLRQLSRETGTAIYYQRGSLLIKSLDGLFSQPEFDTYHYQDSMQESKILAYKSLYRGDLAAELIHKHYAGWNIVDGHITATMNDDQPVEIRPLHTVPQLDGQNWVVIPVIDFGTHGRGELMPGLNIGLKFHRARQGRPLDESLPEKVLIYLVAHHYEANRYSCRVKAGVVKNARD